MKVHIKRRHGGSSNHMSTTAARIPSKGFIHPSMDSPLTYPRSSLLSQDYGHNTYSHESIPFKANVSRSKTEEIQDQIMSNFNKYMRLLEEFNKRSTINSVSNIPQSIIMGLTSNLFQNKHSTPVKNVKLPTGYRMSTCDKCNNGYKLEGVFYPLEFEGMTKPFHDCDRNGLDESGHGYTPGTKSPKRLKLEEILAQIVFSRMDQREAYLKVVHVPIELFTEEERKKFNLTPDRSFIEEKDCIEIELLSRNERSHWSWRAIIQHSNSDKIKLTREELKDFLSIAGSTFAVFGVSMSDPIRKQYFLMYLLI